MSRYPWFRFYTEALYDRKLRRIPVSARWLFVACLAAARQSPQPGRLLVGDTPMTDADLADVASMRQKDVEAGMVDLELAGLVAKDDGCWVIPKWDERQPNSDVSTERVQRHRERKRNVTATPQDREQEIPKSSPPKSQEDSRYEAAVASLVKKRMNKPGITNPDGFRAHVTGEMHRLHGDRIRSLLADFPDAPADAIAAHIDGESSSLRYYTRAAG